MIVGHGRYHDGRSEKTTTEAYVNRTRGGGFDRLGVSTDDDTHLSVRATGGVKSRDSERRLGTDAIVSRLEADDDQDDDADEAETIADGGLTIAEEPPANETV